MYGKFQQHLQTELAAIREAGLYKNERLICGPQQAEINVGGKTVLNFCANNYLGLSNHPRLISAAKAAMDARGYGMSSVRFICGTQDLHKELEAAISRFFKTDDAILYAACFDANGGVFDRSSRLRCHHQRRAQSRLHHRRRSPLQSQALSLCQCRHGRP